MLTLYEGNKFSGERPGKNERYKKYEVINIMVRYYYKVRYSPVGKHRGSSPVFPRFFSHSENIYLRTNEGTNEARNQPRLK